MALPAGKRNKRLTIQSATETRDGFGEADQTWSTYATRWVAIEYEGGDEALAAGADRSEVRALIRMGYDTQAATITAKMRGLLGSTVYEFLTPAMNVNHQNKELQIRAVIRG